MTDKFFYQAAAAEVTIGKIDPALWIKVNADMPTASDVVRQARYIQLRAQEMARSAKVSLVERLIPHSWSQWILFAVVDLLIAWCVAGIGGSDGAVNLAYLIFVLLPIAAVVWKSKHSTTESENTKADQRVGPEKTPPLRILADCGDVDGIVAESNIGPVETVLPMQKDQHPASNFGGAVWLLCVVCLIVGAVLLVVIDVDYGHLPTSNAEYLMGLWFANLLIISVVPLLFGLFTLFRKPGVAATLVFASFLVVVLVKITGHAATQGIANEEANKSNSLQSNNALQVETASQNQQAVLMGYVPVSYPKDAVKARIEGSVLLSFTIGVDGTVSNVEAVDSYPGDIFKTSAVDTVSRYRFKPAMRDGIPTATQMQQRIDFKL